MSPYNETLQEAEFKSGFQNRIQKRLIPPGTIFWTLHNEKITHWIAHFTTTDTTSILQILTAHFNYCLYKTILVIET